MNKRVYILLFSLISSFFTYGQDPHLSQYFSSPLTINPGLTANFESDFRASIVHRQQWWQSNFPFSTSVIGGELKLFKNQLQSGNRLGIGLLFEGDASLGGANKTSKASFSSAYHQTIDANNYQTIGLGIQFSYTNKLLNFNSLGFESQFDGDQIDLTINSGESFTSNFRNYIDVNTGIVYSYNDGEKSFYFGGAIQNLLRPTVSFYSDSSSKIAIRKTIHGGASFFPSFNSTSRLLLSFLLMEQSKSTEINVGSAIGLEINTGYLYIGLFSRFGDVVYPYFSYQTRSFQVGLSYDITTSQLKNSRKNSNSLEISFTYTGRDRTEDKKYMPWNF